MGTGGWGGEGRDGMERGGESKERGGERKGLLLGKGRGRQKRVGKEGKKGEGKEGEGRRSGH